MHSKSKPLNLQWKKTISTYLSTKINKNYKQIYKQNMSDGNFNRQLLPKTELSSGIRAGKAQMRMKAEKAFEEILNTYLTGESEKTKLAMKQKFASLLR